MVSVEKLCRETEAFFKANADEALVQKYSKYFKEGYDAYGVSQGDMDIKKKEILRNPEFSIEFLLRVAPELIKSEKYEETSFVLILLNGLNKKFNKNVFAEIERWYKLGITNWAHADLIGMIILPQFLLNRIIVYTDLESWLTAKNKFQRRTVPISFIKLLSTVNDFTGLFRFLESLMKDPEKEVSQGMGWFLREAWKMKPRETEEFLMKWKDECPKQIIQYATENMDPDKKKIFKKTELAEKKK